MPDNPTPASQDEVQFVNNAPDDKEWSAHIRVLNKWQNPERLLRDIIQYARSGPFYPADKHVDLIEQWQNRREQALLRGLLEQSEVAGWTEKSGHIKAVPASVIEAELEKLG